MNRVSLCVAAATLSLSQAHAEEKRAADAHEHGHGAFRMAIEEDHAEIELEIPAFDVVGFEHAPSTDEHRAAIAEAAGKLSRPDMLFELPRDAGCVAGEIEIEFGSLGGHDEDEDDDEHEHEDKHDDHAHDDDHKHDHDDHEEDGETHSEVSVAYHLTCEDTGALDSIGFAYFDAFPNAEELEVVILSASGQNAGEVNRDEMAFEIE